MTFVLSLFVPHLYFVGFLGMAVARDCGVFEVCSLIILTLLGLFENNNVNTTLSTSSSLLMK